MWLRVEGGVVAEARLAFGGVGATVIRAKGAEAALTGRPLADGTVAAAAEALERDIAPLGDWRGTAEYRMAVAQGLLRRLHLRAAYPDLPHDVAAFAEAV
jgi:xanthine dehydrogenase small subunit